MKFSKIYDDPIAQKPRSGGEALLAGFILRRLRKTTQSTDSLKNTKKMK